MSKIPEIITVPPEMLESIKEAHSTCNPLMEQCKKANRAGIDMSDVYKEVDEMKAQIAKIIGVYG